MHARVHACTHACFHASVRACVHACVGFICMGLRVRACVLAGLCVDNDKEVKKLSGGKATLCAAVADMCHNGKIGAAVSSLCPKT